MVFSTYENVTYEDAKSEQEAVNGSEDYTFDGAKSSTEGLIIVTTSDTENILATVTEEYDDTTVPLMTEVIIRCANKLRHYFFLIKRVDDEFISSNDEVLNC